MDYRIYVEKLPRFQVEAQSLLKEFNLNLNLNLKSLRYVNVYDLRGFSKELLEKTKYTVFGEVVTDNVTEDIDLSKNKYIAVEYLPGQFDQRASSAVDCVKLVDPHADIIIKSSRLIILDKDVDDPAQWDKWIEPSRDSEGRPVGYISTSAISDGMLNLAGGAYDDETVLYGFTDLTGGDVFRFAAEYDVYTGVSEDSESGGKKLTVGLQDFFFEHPREVIDRTRKRLRRIPDAYNEIALNRYPGGNDSPEARMRPNAIIVFGKDESAITERVKRHAVYFGKTKPRAEGDSSPVTGIPIILIDPEKYGRK